MLVKYEYSKESFTNDIDRWGKSCWALLFIKNVELALPEHRSNLSEPCQLTTIGFSVIVESDSIASKRAVIYLDLCYSKTR